MFAAIFQLPTVVLFLARLGLVTARFLIKNFKYAILIMVIAGAVLSPGGDPVGQMLFARADVRALLLQHRPGVAVRQEEAHDGAVADAVTTSPLAARSGLRSISTSSSGREAAIARLRDRRAAPPAVRPAVIARR